MGLTFSSLFQQLFGKKQMRILMVGLDAAGKHDARPNPSHAVRSKVKQRFSTN